MAIEEGAGRYPERYCAAAATSAELGGETRKKSLICLPVAGSVFIESPVTVDPMTGIWRSDEIIAAALRVRVVLWPSPMTEVMCRATALALICPTAARQDR